MIRNFNFQILIYIESKCQIFNIYQLYIASLKAIFAPFACICFQIIYDFVQHEQIILQKSNHKLNDIELFKRSNAVGTKRKILKNKTNQNWAILQQQHIQKKNLIFFFTYCCIDNCTMT